MLSVALIQAIINPLERDSILVLVLGIRCLVWDPGNMTLDFILISRTSYSTYFSIRRSSCGVAALDGYLYCIGGSDGTMCLLSGEKYNLRACAWEGIAPMHSRRSTHEVVEANGYLYALGGNDGSSSLNSVERYDPKLNKWNIVTSMLTRRSSIGASVLECFNLEKKIVQTSI